MNTKVRRVQKYEVLVTKVKNLRNNSNKDEKIEFETIKDPTK